MTSRPRKEQGHFELQPETASRNGHADRPAEGRDGQEHRNVSPSPAAEATGGTQLGKIEVSPRAIAHVASRAAQRSYGVVGLAARHARPGWAELLRRDEAHKGVDVNFSSKRVTIDLYVVLEYGTRI